MNDDLRKFEIDERLRRVPVPEGLVERLRAARVPVGEALDEAVRGVPVPAELNDRLKQAIADEIIDERLCHVDLPWGLMARLRVIPQHRTRGRVGRWAVAASLLLVIGGGYLSGMVALLGAMRPAGNVDVAELLVIDNGPVEVTAELSKFASAEIVTQGVIEPQSTPQAVVAEGPLPRLAAFDEPATPGPAGNLFQQLRDGLRLESDIFILRIGPLGATVSADDRLPEFEAISLPPAGGIEPPAVAPRCSGFDRNFLITRSVFPPAFPAADPRLQEVQVPLNTSTASYELTHRLVREHRLPDPEAVRVEEFLAAIPYDYEPVEPGQLGIRTSAGPQVFGQPGAGLIQIGVVAGEAKRRVYPATHLTIALDMSTSMAQHGRWDKTRLALSRGLGDLGPRDRFSLVAFNDGIVQVVETATREDLADVRQTLDSWLPRGGTDLPAGLQRAFSLALAPSDEQFTDRCLVLITDEAQAIHAPSFEKVSQLVRLAADHGLRFSVVDLSDGFEQDSPLAKLAAVGHGVHVRPTSADDIRWQLRRDLTGDGGLVATDAVLRVRFNPQAVYAYRMVGHEPSLMTGGKPAMVERDLRAGEQATALFEVWLLPNDEDDVAWAELQWREPDTGEVRRRGPQRISRLQFATSFAEMPPRLQTAALLAETAEMLRHGYSFWLNTDRQFTPRPKDDTFGPLLRMADEVHGPLAEREEFKSLLDLIRRLDALRAEGATLRLRGQ